MEIQLEKKVQLTIPNKTPNGKEDVEGFFKKAKEGYIFVSREFLGDGVCYSNELAFQSEGLSNAPLIRYLGGGKNLKYDVVEDEIAIEYTFNSSPDYESDSELLTKLGL